MVRAVAAAETAVLEVRQQSIVRVRVRVRPSPGTALGCRYQPERVKKEG